MKHSRLLSAVAFGLVFATANPVFAADNDADGYATPLDCDDNNASIHPGATEITGDSVDQDCDAHENCYVDADDDNYRIESIVLSTDTDCTDVGEGRISDPPGDCDDTDPDVNPAGTEVCDGGDVDEDCDGNADDLDTAAAGKTPWYADADSDSFGDAASSIDACDAPAGHVADATDCDDTDAGINPSHGEICDAADRDEDCDGLADDNDPGATGETAWYADADSDGYGDASVSVDACDPPAGTVAEATDCDDTDSAISPGDPEVCDAADRDEDCDGLADDNDPGATGKTAWYADADSDGYGDASVSVDACNPPAGSVASSTDCDDADAAVSPGDPEVCDSAGRDDDCDSDSDCDDTDCSAAPSCAGTVEVFDHLECFKIKTAEKLKATLDLDPGTSPPFDVAAGCTVSKAAKYCVPVMKTVAAVDASSSLTENPLYTGQELEDHHICYKVKCPADSPPVAKGVVVTVIDRFGERQFEKFKVSEICTPAEVVP